MIHFCLNCASSVCADLLCTCVDYRPTEVSRLGIPIILVALKDIDDELFPLTSMLRLSATIFNALWTVFISQCSHTPYFVNSSTFILHLKRRKCDSFKKFYCISWLFTIFSEKGAKLQWKMWVFQNRFKTNYFWLFWGQIKFFFLLVNK